MDLVVELAFWEGRDTALLDRTRETHACARILTAHDRLPIARDEPREAAPPGARISTERADRGRRRSP